MLLKKGWALLAIPVFLAACGDNSTKNNETTATDTVTTSTQTTTTTVPVSGDVQVPEGISTSFREKYPSSSNASWSRYAPANSFDWEWTGWPMMDSSDYMVRF